MKDDLGDRMKGYENISRIYLTRRMPLIIRIDGKGFHTFTRGFNRPFDEVLSNSIQHTACRLVSEIQGCKFAYTQSDEISLLLTDYDALETDAWFGKNLQKIVSVSASIATLEFNKIFQAWANGSGLDIYRRKMWQAMFDARAFVLPKEEVCNYFIWRQKDAQRNSVSMLARSLMSHHELDGVNMKQAKEIMKEKYNVDWESQEPTYKNGICAYKDSHGGIVKDNAIPNFMHDRRYVERHVYLDE